MSEDDAKVVWVGNIDDRVSEDLLYELFLQAGPIEYVKQPKDKASGRKKNFAFVGYKHECSVPYSIALLNNMKLFGRNLRVQSRYLQSLQAQGLASDDSQGVHTLDPTQRDPLLDEGPGVSHAKESRSLMGPPPSPLDIPPNIPPHILALAHQQMALLNTTGMVPLSQNPALNARMQPRNDRFGSINYNQGYSNSGHDDYNQGYDRNHKNRNRGSRSFDNKTMQSLKNHATSVTAQNSQMLAAIQDQHGRFDRSRLGPSPGHYNEDRYERDYESHHDGRYRQNQDGQHKHGHRDYRQQPYDRYESHHSRHHDRHSPSDNRRKYDEKSRSGGRSHSYNSDRYGRGGEYQPQYNSRR